MKGKQSPGGAAIEGIHKSPAHMGQTIMRAGPLDKSTPGTPKSTEGTFGGGPENLSHSLGGATAKARG